MRFLLDTNVLIKLRPRTVGEIELGAESAARLNQLLAGGEHSLIVHPAIEYDIERGGDADRRELNHFLFVEQYPQLTHPPNSRPVEEVLGSPDQGSNDWVDMQLIAAIHANAIDYVITEDAGLIRKTRRAGFADRALSISEAVQVLEDLFERILPPPPIVEHVPMYALERQDPIWETFRDEYDGFDDWFERVCRDGRPAWYVQGENGYRGVCIIKPEDDRPHGLEGRVLKICSFKIAQGSRGAKLGELLLKTVFRHASENGYAAAYVEAFPWHDELFALLEDFGFEVSDVHSTPRDERVLIKPLVPDDAVADSLSHFEFHRRYGPPALHPTARLYVVPILPQYHKLLFPDVPEPVRPDEHPRLPGLEEDPIQPRPYGNSIKKAYLSHAGIRQLTAGDLLVFYRSQDLRSLTTVGVVEDTLVSEDPDEIASYVGPRTVYTFEEITAMTQGGPVLSILFRHDRSIDPIAFHDMIREDVLQAAPQSISAVRVEGQQWLRTQLGE